MSTVLAAIGAAAPRVLEHRRVVLRFEIAWNLFSFLLLGPATVALFHDTIALSGEPVDPRL